MNDAADFRAQAERRASEMLAEYGTPDEYDAIHNLVALAYAQGARDELEQLPARVDEVVNAILSELATVKS